MKKILQILLIIISTLSCFGNYVNWKNFEIKNTPPKKFEEAPNGYFYLQTTDGNFFKSTDKGKNWIEIDIDSVGYYYYDETYPLHDFAILPSGTIIITKTWQIFRSTDYGENWQTIIPELTYSPSIIIQQQKIMNLYKNFTYQKMKENHGIL